MNIRSIKTASTQSLAEASYNPKKLALIHTGAALVLSALLTVINYLLTRSIDTTAGLAGIGTRAVLTSAQSLLSIAGSIALPFWEIGFLRAALCIAHRSDVEPKTLAAGFRRAGPVFRLLLLQGLLYIGVAMACSYAATSIFIFSPFSDGMLETMDALLANGDPADLALQNDVIIKTLLPTMIPAYVIFGILFLVVAIPLFYRFRMAQYALMDDAPGAVAAMKSSSRMMRGNRLSLFKLDLSFWWFYGAQVLIALVAYADTLFPMLGITLPINGDVLFFIFYAVHLLLQLAVAWGYSSYIHTTYAHCYDTLRQNIPPVSSAQNAYKNLPWV